MIRGQIILTKQVNSHVYTIEVRYMPRMSIVNSLHARVYCPFQGGATFVDHFLLFMFHASFVLLSCLFLVALWSPAGRGWLLG